jgi:hypothetical protein
MKMVLEKCVERSRTGAERRTAKSVDHGEMRGGRSRGEARRGEENTMSYLSAALHTSPLIHCIFRL